MYLGAAAVRPGGLDGLASACLRTSTRVRRGRHCSFRLRLLLRLRCRCFRSYVVLLLLLCQLGFVDRKHFRTSLQPCARCAWALLPSAVAARLQLHVLLYELELEYRLVPSTSRYMLLSNFDRHHIYTCTCTAPVLDL